ncbi:aconitate hydratase [Minwuia thermotolerans]|uniref:Aconitate hydratase n=1 Tax=Minwuia thermotolerans TaxID=2056226 RepID=A0A2M9FXV7_9PROT|nr:aconitate hydratase [Minwuia thermotolerans]PJK28298.1 aconitate hydratase [Minwuia thermotolerans]
MAENLTRKLIAEHLLEGRMKPGEPIHLAIDQTLTQDATGTLVMLALEAMALERVKTEVSVQYVDHNLLQTDNRNPDDHLFLESACRRFGVWFSPPGNGVSHPLHTRYFCKPGRTLLGADSHTPAAGAMGMLAMGAGGIDVAMAMAGEPFVLDMPEVWGVRLIGELPDWVSAKDVILEMLRRHGVAGGRGRVIEYHGPGLEALGVMDRHVIANMGTELGATSSVFPADAAVRDYLALHGRDGDHTPWTADDGAGYDHHEKIDLSELEPLIAKPSSPGNVVPVRDVAGAEVYQAYFGSSANPGFRDFAVVAEMMRGRNRPAQVSLDINPASRDDLRDLAGDGHLSALLAAGARLHQAGCNGCIGMGQAPATGRNSLRTVPRNFPDRSGTPEDSVFLCSPETAAAAALTGRITDPRELDMAHPKIAPPRRPAFDWENFAAPPRPQSAEETELVKGPNIASIPDFEAMPDELDLQVLLKLGDDISTDEIMPAGTDILPYRSNIPKIAEFAFRVIDKGYAKRAAAAREERDGHVIVAGENYGQGSSREHAAIAPRALGLRAVAARSFARIHRQNLINYGVAPLLLDDEDDPGELDQDGRMTLSGLRGAVADADSITARTGRGAEIVLRLDLGAREREVLLAGGLVNWWRAG